jgi:hypothetical protein
MSAMMPRQLLNLIPTFAALAALGGVDYASSESAAPSRTVALVSCKDNTLIESETGESSNGAGNSIRTGRMGDAGNNLVLRALLAFDCSSIPPHAHVIDATLELSLLMSASGPIPTNLHRMLADWGEGASNSDGGLGAPSQRGDATWLHCFYPTSFWAAPGGDFDPAVHASVAVGTLGAVYQWTGPDVIADVQSWIDHPATNFGWMLRGDEINNYSAKRFGSHEVVPPYQPHLIITFTLPSQCPGDVNNDGIVNIDDLLGVITSWGQADSAADVNQDGTVNIDDLLAVINAWGTAC